MENANRIELIPIYAYPWPTDFAAVHIHKTTSTFVSCANSIKLYIVLLFTLYGEIEIEETKGTYLEESYKSKNVLQFYPLKPTERLSTRSITARGRKFIYSRFLNFYTQKS